MLARRASRGNSLSLFPFPSPLSRLLARHRVTSDVVGAQRRGQNLTRRIVKLYFAVLARKAANDATVPG